VTLQEGKMKSIITLLLVLSIIFLIDYLRRRKKGPSQQENESAEQSVTSGRDSIAASHRTGRLKPSLIKIGKFVLLYFVVVLLSSALSGFLGAISKNFSPQLYTVAKFGAPSVVYFVVFYFLVRRYSLRTTAGLMLSVYGLVSFLRVVFVAGSSDVSSSDVAQSVLPYISLTLLSCVVYIVSRSKASTKLNRGSDGN
jgi:hypothetical protein